MEVKLNLGCGKDIRDNWINYDKYPINKKVKYIDLSKLPLPFPDNYANIIYLGGVYEHLFVNHFELMKELSRICKPNGKVIILVRADNNNFDHEKHDFDPFYFNPIITSYQMFKTITFKKQKRGLTGIIWQIKKILSRIFYKEFIFEFIK